jgi:TonB family protein
VRTRSLIVTCIAALAAAGCGERDVEPPMMLVESTEFDYPPSLWDEELEGETVLMIHVRADGRVDSVYVHESSGFFAFDSAALAGGRRLEFAAGRKGRRHVGMWTRVPVRFSRDGGSGT